MSIKRICILGALIIAAFAATAQSYEAYIDSAENFIKRERWSDAAASIRKSLKINPGSPLNSKLFSNLGICLTHTGDYTGAIQAFGLALIKEPDSPQILYSRASARVLAEDYLEARRDLSLALQSDSTYQDALRLRGQLLLADNRFAEAEKDFITLNEHYPDDPWGYAGRGECRNAVQDYQAAIALFSQALKKEENADFRISQISSMLGDKEYSAAENAIIEAIKLYPNVGDLYLLRGTLHKATFRNSDVEIDKKLAKEYGVDAQTIEIYLK